MTVLLTSFRRFHEMGACDRPRGVSIAVYQPKWFDPLPVFRCFDIRDKSGRWTRPREFVPCGHDPADRGPEILAAYRNYLLGLYVERRSEIRSAIAGGEDLALCCWCPYDRAARRQIDAFGSYVCHSAVVELILDLLGVEVVRDADRARMVRW